MFEDDDLDLSSGSDFDDDEDPDKIEVPGEWNYWKFKSCSLNTVHFSMKFLYFFYVNFFPNEMKRNFLPAKKRWKWIFLKNFEE